MTRHRANEYVGQNKTLTFSITPNHQVSVTGLRKTPLILELEEWLLLLEARDALLGFMTQHAGDIELFKYLDGP